jgi:hypothetical protein
MNAVTKTDTTVCTFRRPFLINKIVAATVFHEGDTVYTVVGWSKLQSTIGNVYGLALKLAFTVRR